MIQFKEEIYKQVNQKAKKPIRFIDALDLGKVLYKGRLYVQQVGMQKKYNLINLNYLLDISYNSVTHST